MTDLSYNDGNSPTDKESQVPLFSRMRRSSIDESSNSSPSPVNFKQIINPPISLTNPNKDPMYNNSAKDINGFYSFLAFTADNLCHSAPVPPENSGNNNNTEKTNSDNQKINDKRLLALLCQFCGQCHDKNLPHLYDYSQPVDSNLLCIICHQPLVDPLEANCSHTFCTACLENHLTVQALCPLDNIIINYLSCKPASIIVKKLLDKLKVVCPNVDYCEEVVYRNDLYYHLKYKCRGAVIPCINSVIGCTFQGSRNSFSTHQWECKFKNMENGRDPMANDMSNLQLQDQQEQNHQVEPDQGCDEIIDFHSKKDCQSKERNAIVDGEPCEIEITRINRCDLGFSFIGGSDSPLGCILIQEIYLDGIISQDCRLRPGDQLLKINGFDLMTATHAQAKHALCTAGNKLKLMVLREQAPMIGKLDTFSVKLMKRPDSQLGIVLDKKKSNEGIYIRNIISGSEAQLNGSLLKGDRILSINNIDIGNGTQEFAAKIFKEALDSITLVVQRKSNVPDIVKITDDHGSLGSWSTSSTGCGGSGLPRDSNAPPHSEMVSRRHTISSNKSSLWSDHSAPNVINNNLNFFEKSKSSSISVEQSPWVPQSAPLLSTFDNNGGGDGSGIYQHLILPSSLLKEDIVHVLKPPHESLCISVTGGINSKRGDIPIYISNIFANGPLSFHKKIKKGTILLAINDISLLYLTHKDAVDILKQQCCNSTMVRLHILEGPETSSLPGNFMPSWKYWLQLPLYCATKKLIELYKDSATVSLGFSIIGGIDAAIGSMQPMSFWDTCIMIKTILPGSVINGKLKCGDILLEVNNTSLVNISHADAVTCLKRTTNRVILKIISWPGTIV